MLPLVKGYEMETKHRVKYSNPDNTRNFFQCLIGFVDDNSILLKLEGLGYTHAIEGLLTATKTCMDIWQRLHITGGELELDKRSYAAMTWQFKEGKEKMYTISDTHGNVSLRS